MNLPLKKSSKELPKGFFVESSTLVTDESIGQILLQKGEIVFQLADDEMNYSNGIALIDVRHLLARPDIFTPVNDIQPIKSIE